MKRRASGEGGCTHRKDGRWQASLKVGPARKFFYGSTQSEALHKLNAARRALERGELMASPEQTVADYIDSWLEDVVKNHKSPRTYMSYKCNLKHVKRELGHYRLADLRPAHITRAYNNIPLQPVTIQSVHAAFRAALNQAVEWGTLMVNPAVRAKRPQVLDKERALLTEDTVSQLLDATTGERLHALWVLFLGTGLRVGEACGLRWSDVDLEKSRLWVRQTVYHVTGRGMTVGRPKTARSKRPVRLPQEVVTALQAHRERQRFTQPDSELVFPTPNGTPYYDGDVRRQLVRALEKAGLPRMRVHDLRHSWATMMLQTPGVTLNDVGEAAGHANATVTLRTYGHVTDSSRQNLADAADRILRRKKL